MRGGQVGHVSFTARIVAATFRGGFGWAQFGALGFTPISVAGVAIFTSLARQVHTRAPVLRWSVRLVRASAAVRCSLLLFTLAVAMSVSAPAGAQVNVEPLRQQVTERKFGARINASTTTYAGNTRGVVFGGAALLGGRTARHFGYLDLSGDYARLAGVVSIAKWFLHLRHNLQISADAWWEEYAQLESDRFRRVQLRELVGTGPRVRLLHRDWLDIYFGSSYMIEHTELNTADIDPAGQGTFERWSNYAAIHFRPDARIALSSVNYLQPRLSRFEDYKILSVSSADFTITSRFHSRLDVTARYESFAPSDVRRTDLELKSSFEIVF